MKVYKGFDKNMTCRGFRYEEGQTYELPEGEKAELCEEVFMLARLRWTALATTDLPTASITKSNWTA